MSANHYYGRPLVVAVKNGRLVISIGTHVLAHAVSYADWANPYDEARQDYIRTFAIANAETFAKDVMHAMLDEREDGSSPLSDFLDKMTEAALDDGSEACEYEQTIKHGEHAASETWAEQLERAEALAPSPDTTLEVQETEEDTLGGSQ